MSHRCGRFFVGTSGWTYPSWKGVFYPIDLPNARWLEFFAGQFPATEINYSFYHPPKVSTYEKWASRVLPSRRRPIGTVSGDGPEQYIPEETRKAGMRVPPRILVFE